MAPKAKLASFGGTAAPNVKAGFSAAPTGAAVAAGAGATWPNENAEGAAAAVSAGAAAKLRDELWRGAAALAPNWKDGTGAPVVTAAEVAVAREEPSDKGAAEVTEVPKANGAVGPAAVLLADTAGAPKLKLTCFTAVVGAAPLLSLAGCWLAFVSPDPN